MKAMAYRTMVRSIRTVPRVMGSLLFGSGQLWDIERGGYSPPGMMFTLAQRQVWLGGINSTLRCETHDMNVSGDNRKEGDLGRTQELFGWLARVSLGMRK